MGRRALDPVRNFTPLHFTPGQFFALPERSYFDPEPIGLTRSRWRNTGPWLVRQKDHWARPPDFYRPIIICDRSRDLSTFLNFRRGPCPQKFRGIL